MLSDYIKQLLNLIYFLVIGAKVEHAVMGGLTLHVHYRKPHASAWVSDNLDNHLLIFNDPTLIVSQFALSVCWPKAFKTRQLVQSALTTGPTVCPG